MLSPPTVMRGGDTLEYGMSAREKEPISPCFGGGKSFLEGDSVMFSTLTAEKGSREGEIKDSEKIFEKFFVKIFKKY